MREIVAEYSYKCTRYLKSSTSVFILVQLTVLIKSS